MLYRVSVWELTFELFPDFAQLLLFGLIAFTGS